ncbi:TMEM175 family protein [Streptomyces sp. DSM 41982]|uniref:TMEM175 family protein n=2 Tax=Streptomyces TaxID=1883 RepID=A0ABD5E077_9ACTN|nr:TMEM175 family protein [Streptomyces sp. DSM 41982]MDT0414831.1 TMEM175 family protein [Streptomyces sp. DSM 41982]
MPHEPKPGPPGDSPGPGAHAERDPSARFRRSDTSRLEAISDGVFAVALTLLVLELNDPPHRNGGLPRALLHQWPAYVGYVASFSYVGVIWLNHHQAFARIRSVDRALSGWNLALVGITSALAFPTSVVSETLSESATGRDARTAVALYAFVAALMCTAWLVLYRFLLGRPGLMEPHVEPGYLRHGVTRSAVGVVAYVLAGLLGVFVTPLVALGVFVVLPVFYFLTTEGMPKRGATG